MANKPHFLELDQHEMGRLTAFMKQMSLKGNWRAHRRAQAIYLSSKYKTPAQIAHELNCSLDTVYRWLGAYRKQGLEGLRDKYPPHKYHPSKLTSQQADQIMKISGRTGSKNLKHTRHTLSLRKMVRWIKDHWHITLSHECLRQIILKHNRGKDETL